MQMVEKASEKEEQREKERLARRVSAFCIILIVLRIKRYILAGSYRKGATRKGVKEGREGV